jgi:hypothetical protein
MLFFHRAERTARGLMGQDPFSFWYSVPEIARRLGKHPRSIRRAAERGELAGGIRVLGQLHFRWEAIAKWLGILEPNFKHPPPPADPWPVDLRARTPGELRRRVERLKPSPVNGSPGHLEL